MILYVQTNCPSHTLTAQAFSRTEKSLYFLFLNQKSRHSQWRDDPGDLECFLKPSALISVTRSEQSQSLGSISSFTSDYHHAGFFLHKTGSSGYFRRRRGSAGRLELVNTTTYYTSFGNQECQVPQIHFALQRFPRYLIRRHKNFYVFVKILCVAPPV